MGTPLKSQALSGWQKLLVFLLLAALLIGVLFAVHGFLEQLPLGADFYTFWVAARAAFVENQNPYSSAVTQQSQMGIYGRPAHPWEDQVAFAYPPYSLFLIAPLSLSNYPWAETIWLVANVILVVSVIYLAFPRSPKWLPFTFLAFYPVAFGLILGNYVVTISAFLILFFGFFAARKDPPIWLQATCGVLLAWATIKPQFMWLFLLFILLVSIRNRYRVFLASLGISWLVFFGSSFLLVPGWLNLWLGRIREYAGYVQSSPTVMNLFSLILPEKPALAMSALAGVLITGLTIWMIYRWYQKRIPDIHLFLWFGLATYFVHPHGISYEQLCILVPLLCWLATLASPKKWVYPVFWFFPLILSWGIFALSKWVFPPADELPLVYFTLLFAWILLSGSGNRFINPNPST